MAASSTSTTSPLFIYDNNTWSEYSHIDEILGIGNEFTIHVGSSLTNSKTVDLPYSNMTVGTTPFILQDSTVISSSDEDNTFSVSVTGNQLTVTRSYNNENSINVGDSGAKTKTVTLPYSYMRVDPNPINTQNSGWPDTFSVSVSGTQLTVTRTDANVGWGQPLVLQYLDGWGQNLVLKGTVSINKLAVNNDLILFNNPDS